MYIFTWAGLVCFLRSGRNQWVGSSSLRHSEQFDRKTLNRQRPRFCSLVFLITHVFRTPWKPAFCKFRNFSLEFACICSRFQYFTMTQLQNIRLPTPQNEHKVKNHYMSVNKLSNKIRKNSKLFSIYRGVVDTGDQPLLWIYPWIFAKSWNYPNGILRGLEETDSWKKPEVKNLVADSL